MGRKWFEDIIPAMVKLSSTQVQLPAPAHLTIGGQQYHLTSALQLTLSGLSAATLYFIYAVVSSGVVSLVQSTRVNSLGPVGYTSWKLVGALYSDALASPAFGSFVNIDGPPSSQMIAWLPTFSAALGSVTNVNLFFKRDGGLFRFQGRFKTGTVTNTTPSFTLPVTVDTAQVAASLNTLCGRFLRGITATGDGTYGGEILIDPANPTNLYFSTGNNTQASGNKITDATTEFNNTEDDQIYGGALPVSGWSNTPLKDL
jgi:hypothetical protein